MIPADFLELLRCPQSGQPLALAEASVLEPLNERIAQGSGAVRNQGGTPVEQLLSEALLRTDRTLVYPVRDGIPLLLTEEGILL